VLLNNVAALNVVRDGLPLCTSVTTVRLFGTNHKNEQLERLIPAFYNTSVTSLELLSNSIRGHRGGEVLRNLLVGNNNILKLDLSHTHHINPEGAIALGHCLFIGNTRLQNLILHCCFIGLEGLTNLLLPAVGGDAMINNSLTYLNLSQNQIPVRKVDVSSHYCCGILQQ
jgi:hypothetical protein